MRLTHLGPAADGESVNVVVPHQLLHGEVVAGGGGYVPNLAPEPCVQGLKGELVSHPVHVGLHLLLGDGLQSSGRVLGEPHVLEHHAKCLAHQEGVWVEVGEAWCLVTYQSHLVIAITRHVCRPPLLLTVLTLVSWM